MVIRTLVVIGVGMIMGDGVLTPAVSVVSAVEGLSQASPVFQKGDRAPSGLPSCFKNVYMLVTVCCWHHWQLQFF